MYPFFFFFALQTLQTFSDLHNKSVYQNNTMITGFSGIITMKYWLLFQTYRVSLNAMTSAKLVCCFETLFIVRRDAIEAPWTTHKHPSNCVFSVQYSRYKKVLYSKYKILAVQRLFVCRY